MPLSLANRAASGVTNGRWKSGKRRWRRPQATRILAPRFVGRSIAPASLSQPPMGGEPALKPAVSAGRSNPRAGFTLLETLAALAIAAAALAVIVDFSMRTLRNWHR